MYLVYLISIFFKLLTTASCSILCFLIGNYKKKGIALTSRFDWSLGGVGWVGLFLSSLNTAWFISSIAEFARTFNPTITIISQLLQAAAFGCIFFHILRIYVGLRKIQ